MSPLLNRVLLARAKQAFVPASQEAMGPGGQPVSPTPDQAAPPAGAMDPAAAAPPEAAPVDPAAAAAQAPVDPAALPPEASAPPAEVPPADPAALPPAAPPSAGGDVMVPLNAVKDLVTGVIEATKGKRTAEGVKADAAAAGASPVEAPMGGPITGMPMPEGGAPQGPLKLGHTISILKRAAAAAIQAPPAVAPKPAPAPSMVAQLLGRRAQVAAAPAPQLKPL